MDPYRSHMQFTAAVNSTTQPVGELTLDTSAESIVSQLVISSNQV
jgi:hypothetical protein